MHVDVVNDKKHRDYNTTEQSEARRLAVDDPHTFMTLDACIQVARQMYGMIVEGMGRRLNPNNVINFDESLGYTPYWYVKHSRI